VNCQGVFRLAHRKKGKKKGGGPFPTMEIEGVRRGRDRGTAFARSVWKKETPKKEGREKKGYEGPVNPMLDRSTKKRMELDHQHPHKKTTSVRGGKRFPTRKFRESLPSAEKKKEEHNSGVPPSLPSSKGESLLGGKKIGKSCPSHPSPLRVEAGNG